MPGEAVGPTAESCPIRSEFPHALPTATCLYSLITLNPLHSHITLSSKHYLSTKKLSSPLPNPRHVLMAKQALSSSQPLKPQHRPLNSISSATPNPRHVQTTNEAPVSFLTLEALAPASEHLQLYRPIISAAPVHSIKFFDGSCYFFLNICWLVLCSWRFLLSVGWGFGFLRFNKYVFFFFFL